MESKIEEVYLPNGESVFLKKGFDGYRVIFPLKNKDGSWNWKHVIFGGSIWSFLKILAIFTILILAIVVYHYDTQTCTNTLKHIDEVCAALQKGQENPYLNNITLPVYNASK